VYNTEALFDDSSYVFGGDPDPKIPFFELFGT
jgi:hypothetical protein